MSKTDLNRLIVRKSYFIPLQQSDLKEAILKELNASDPPIYSHYAWFVSKEHKSSWMFERWYGYHYIREQSLGKYTPEAVKKTAKEYSARTQELFYPQLNRVLGSLLDRVYVSATVPEANGCFANVECLPALYRQIQQLVGKKVEEYEIQDAYLTCERETRHIFEGGLSATLVTEEKKRTSEPMTILLINDSFTRQITEQINEMISSATNEILILGWVGTYYLSQLQKMKIQGIKIRAITHKPNELKTPVTRDVQKGFTELIRLIGLDNVSVNPMLHGRALIVDNKALVGSMDLNSHSLSGEHMEFATYTEDANIVRTLRSYFERTFKPLKEKQDTSK